MYTLKGVSLTIRPRIQLLDEPSREHLVGRLYAWEGVVIKEDSDTSIPELLQATALERTMRTGLRVYPEFTDKLSKSSLRVEFCLAIDQILDNPISEL